MALELKLGQEQGLLLAGQRTRFEGNDEFEGGPATLDSVDEFLKARNQMGLLVGGYLNKQPPRKDIDVIITGTDIQPGELGVDWWWIDPMGDVTYNKNNFSVPLNPVAKRVLCTRRGGLYAVRGLFEVTNSNLPVQYLDLSQALSERSSPILNMFLFHLAIFSYGNNSMIGVLTSYDDTFVEFKDVIEPPEVGLRFYTPEKKEIWKHSNLADLLSYEFQKALETNDRRQEFRNELESGDYGEVNDIERGILKRQIEAIQDRVPVLYNALQGLQKSVPQEQQGDKNARFYRDYIDFCRRCIGQTTGIKEAYILLRNMGILKNYIEELNRLHELWEEERYFGPMKVDDSGNLGKYHGDLVINKLAIGEMR